ncbi:MAG: ATP-binding protein [Patescibacteria group bacterium]
MDIISFLPLISAIFVFLIGIAILLANYRSSINLTFFLFSLAVFLWFLGTFFLFQNCGDKAAAIFWDKFIYFGVIFIPATLFHFSVIFTKNHKQKYVILNYLISFIFLGFLFTPYFVNDLFIYEYGCHTVANFGHNLFLIYFGIVLLMSHLSIYKSYKKSKDLNLKKEARLIFVAFLALTIGSLAFLPAYKITIFPSPYLAGIISVIVLAYGIGKYQLFNVKVIATELLIFIIWLASLVKILLAKNSTERIFEGSLFIFVIIFGILIIRSVLNEVKRKEEMEKLSRKLAAANARLKELDKLKSDFVSIASHQLRSPLTVIKGYGSMILEGSFGEISKDVKNAVDKIYQSSERLISFVNDLLDASRIERGKMEYNFEKADIFEIVSSVVEEFQLAAKKKGLILELEKEIIQIPPLKLDANKIRQIILNFIDNAIKYTPRGNINVNVLKIGERVEIKVKDTGLGIDKKDQEKIFDQFMRINGKDTAGSIGAGLGLYVARQIARAHGGEVFVESEGQGRGSTFILKLPIENKK